MDEWMTENVIFPCMSIHTKHPTCMTKRRVKKFTPMIGKPKNVTKMCHSTNHPPCKRRFFDFPREKFPPVSFGDLKAFR